MSHYLRFLLIFGGILIYSESEEFRRKADMQLYRVLCMSACMYVSFDFT